MKKKISGIIFLLAALSEVIVNAPKILEQLTINKMTDKTTLLEIALLIIMIVFGCTYLFEKWKELKEKFKAIDKGQTTFNNKEYETFHQWLIDERSTGFSQMAESSLEGRIVAMLEWWDERKKKVSEDKNNPINGN